MQARHFVPCVAVVSVALTLLLVGGVSAGGLATLALVLACPLTMVFMMRSMSAHGGGHRDHDDTAAKEA